MVWIQIGHYSQPLMVQKENKIIDFENTWIGLDANNVF